MRFESIASGSSGNCIYVGSDTTHLLMDVGISRKRTVDALHDLDLDLRDIDGIFITHEHSDHISGLPMIDHSAKCVRYSASLQPPIFSAIQVLQLRPYMPKARFAVCTQPIGAGQDGFAYNYGAGWNEVQHRKIMFALNREIEAWVRGLNDPRVELVALGQALDPFHSFVHTEMPVNAVSDAKADLAVNAVHPNAEGGYQMGDTLAAWLRCRWNEFAITNDIGRGD